MKCILGEKYDLLMNAIMYNKFITKILKRRYSQYALLSLVRSGMVLANQAFLMAFMVIRNNWRKKVSLTVKNNADALKRKLVIMQKPTSNYLVTYQKKLV